MLKGSLEGLNQKLIVIMECYNNEVFKTKNVSGDSLL